LFFLFLFSFSFDLSETGSNQRNIVIVTIGGREGALLGVIRLEDGVLEELAIDGNAVVPVGDLQHVDQGRLFCQEVWERFFGASGVVGAHEVMPDLVLGVGIVDAIGDGEAAGVALAEANQERAKVLFHQRVIDVFAREEAVNDARLPQRADMPLITQFLDDFSKPAPKIVETLLCDGRLAAENFLMQILKIRRHERSSGSDGILSSRAQEVTLKEICEERPRYLQLVTKRGLFDECSF